MRSNTVSRLMIKAHTLLGLLILLPAAALAQDDSAFLACDQVEERSQRLACLEAALDAATNKQQATLPSTEASISTPIRENTSRVPEADSAKASVNLPDSDDTPATATNEAVESFGVPEPRVAENAAGDKELHDTITSVEALRPNQWRIVLASGQVWFQVHPKRFNLRAGYPVRIYPSNWGENYRLDSDKLNGFIQVQRLE